MEAYEKRLWESSINLMAASNSIKKIPPSKPLEEGNKHKTSFHRKIDKSRRVFLMLFFRCIMDSIWNYVWLIRRLFTQYNACFSQSQLNKPLVDTTLKQCQRSTQEVWNWSWHGSVKLPSSFSLHLSFSEQAGSVTHTLRCCLEI